MVKSFLSFYDDANEDSDDDSVSSRAPEFRKQLCAPTGAGKSLASTEINKQDVGPPLG